MLITLIIILLLIWAAVVWSIYSNFLVFYSNFSESENYHKAYYASISALERWELVIKQRAPWYEWKGWYIWSLLWWPPFGGSRFDDSNLSWFSYFSTHKNESAILRDIKSRTTRIPATWKWDVEEMLATWDSSNYNMMNYENAEIFLLYNDITLWDENPYKTWDKIKKVPLSNISWKIRLPALLSNKFWPLNTWKSLIRISNALPADDAIVDRQIRWQILSWSIKYPFTIYSTPSLNIWWWTPTVRRTQDSVFRESDINEQLTFNFWNDNDVLLSGSSPLSRSRRNNTRTVITQFNSKGLSNPVIDGSFQRVFSRPEAQHEATDIQLRFSLLNLVEGFDGVTWHIYPFLEYYADFWGKEVPDKYFTIDAEWAFKDHQVNTIVQKPTIKESILWSFTSIF